MRVKDFYQNPILLLIVLTPLFLISTTQVFWSGWGGSNILNSPPIIVLLFTTSIISVYSTYVSIIKLKEKSGIVGYLSKFGYILLLLVSVIPTFMVCQAIIIGIFSLIKLVFSFII